VQVETFNAISDLSSCDGSTAFVLKDCGELSKLVHTEGFQSPLKIFMNQYAMSSQCKVDGRVQAAAKPNVMQPSIRKAMFACTPFADLTKIRVEQPSESIDFLDNVSTFACSASMPVFANMEFLSLGQARYLITGTRMLHIAPLAKLKVGYASAGLPTTSVDSMIAALKVMDKDGLEKIIEGGASIFTVQHTANNLLYIPPLSVVVEKVLNTKEVIGLRSAVLFSSMANEYSEHVGLVAKENPKAPTREKMEKVVEFQSQASLKVQ
jgi:hypothetical protein